MPELTTEEILNMTILGMDWGARRIGFAIKPAGMDYVLPREVLTVGHEEEAIVAVRGVIEGSAAEAIVVGLPLNQDPAQARVVRRFCRKTRRGMTGVRWFFADEHLTTQAADSISKNRAEGDVTDDLAAKLILETWLQSG
jgi:putative transcription antitermination factor YqgF